MATIFIILFVLALFHFIYESILLPSFRLESRYKLFQLRDELRGLKNDEENGIEDDVFFLLEDTVNITINRLPYFNLSTGIEANREYKENKEFQKRVEKRKKTLESCENKRVFQVNKKLLDISALAFILNSGGWMYILIPIFLVLVLFAIITSSIRSFRSKLFSNTYKVAYASNNDFSHFAHLA